MGIRFITISGGEPLLYPDLFKMCEEFSDLMFMSYTNSTLIDEAMAVISRALVVQSVVDLWCAGVDVGARVVAVAAHCDVARWL